MGYLAVDLSTTIPFSVFSARAAIKWINEHELAVGAIAISALAFFAPDIFVVVTAKHVPQQLWSGFGIAVIGFAILAIRRILLR